MKAIFLLSIASFVLGCAEIPQTNIDQPEVNAPQSGSLSETEETLKVASELYNTEQITNFTDFPVKGNRMVRADFFNHCNLPLPQEEEEEKKDITRSDMIGSDMRVSCVIPDRDTTRETKLLSSGELNAILFYDIPTFLFGENEKESCKRGLPMPCPRTD